MREQTGKMPVHGGTRRRSAMGVMLLAIVAGALSGCGTPNPADLSTYQGYPNRDCESLSVLEQTYDKAVAEATAESTRSHLQLHLNLVRYWQGKRECSSKAVLGTELTPIDPVLVKPLGLDSPGGAVIKLVVKDAAAGRAGLLPGDIILGINGEAIASPADVATALGKLQSSSAAEMMIWRGKRKNVVLVNFSAAATSAAAPSLMDAATADFDAGRFADAARKYQQILQQSPNDALTWYFYGQTMEQLGDAVGAQDAYRRVLAIQPTGQVADYARQALARLSPQATPAAKKAVKKK